MDRIILGRRGVRAGLVLLALPQLAIGVWALVSPSGWFENFPGAGRSWLPLYGAFDEHLVSDVGSTFLALGVLLVLAAVWMDRRVVLGASIAYLVYQVPHAIFHFGADDVLSDGDQIANGIGLVLAIVLAIGIVVASLRTSLRTGSDPQPPALRTGSDPTTSGDGLISQPPRGSDTAPASRRNAPRLAPPPRGLLARIAHAYGRRRYGADLAPTDAYLHAKGLLLAYGAFEMATDRASRVDVRLKLLAELKTAAVVGCEWCMDFGSKLSHDHGIPDRQIQELPIYRESDAFDELERLVIDYAEAMSRTPAAVDDDLAARLREHFDDAQLVELTHVIAIENHRARFNHALGLEPQGFAEGAACVVPELADRMVSAGDRQPRPPDAV